MQRVAEYLCRWKCGQTVLSVLYIFSIEAETKDNTKKIIKKVYDN